MKFIYFSFKHRHRYKDLNNFLKTRVYGKYFILNLGGPIKHFIAKILLFFKIGKGISCDGRPIITDQSKGINFWVRGTILNVPNMLRNLNNNFVTVCHPILDNKKIFQIYPLDIKKTNIKENLKIIYMSRINIETNEDEKNIWEQYKSQILKDFTTIDNREFLETITINATSKEKKLDFYRKLKLLLRFEIIKILKKHFNKKLNLVGSDWNLHSIESSPSNYNIKDNKKMYEGNICLDLGCIEGSSSLYSRSNQIIESGGLIVQSFQSDAGEIWGDLQNKILFKNQETLISILERLLSDKAYSSLLLQQIFENFKNSNNLMEKSLDKIF